MSIRAQAWYLDFTIAMLAFTITLILYFGYVNNYSGQGSRITQSLSNDASSISSSLVLEGFPASWDNSTVVRIGIADSQRVNETKLKLFKNISYLRTKTLFGTNSDYFVFFENQSGSVINIEGICGVGDENVPSDPVLGQCKETNLSSIGYDHLAKSERYLNFNSSLVRMKVYVWQ